MVRRRDAFDRDRSAFAAAWAPHEAAIRDQIVVARERLGQVETPDAVLEAGSRLCMAVGADGLRGELTILRAARAVAALKGSTEVSIADVREIAPMALRHRLRRNPLDEGGSSARIARAVGELFGG